MPIKRPYGAHTGPMQIGNLTFGSLGLGFRRFEALRFEAFVIIISIMTIIIITNNSRLGRTIGSLCI